VRILSVNVGAIRAVRWHDEMVTTAIWKHPVDGRIAIRGVNLDGDDQADREVHGGPDKAVYAYAREDYDAWRDRHGVETEPGLFGENLTTEDVDLVHATVGERWSVGSAILEIAQPRLPCFKLGIRMGDPHFPRRFQAEGRMGAYLRIVREGDVGAGDDIAVLSRPDHGVTLADMVGALRDPSKQDALARVPNLPAFWRRFVAE
jgi:MOSC domain-containing protein YiiM